MVKISPSILSCDYSRMGEEFVNMEQCGADWLHIDVMDGHFVPNITLGAPIVKAMRHVTHLVFDVHLMISDPVKYIPDFLKAGADLITFHIESDSDPAKAIELIKKAGKTPGIAIKPATPAEAVFPYLKDIGMVLVMTVEPGFGGQSFMSDMMPKVAEIKAKCRELGLDNMYIQVDGGISEKTITAAAEAGANVFVSGSAVFGAENPSKAISNMKKLAERAGK